MHTVHAGFSFVCAVKPDRIDEARRVLARIRASADRTFSAAPSTHFVTGSVLPAQQRGRRELPPTLLFLTSYWGPTRVHLAELCAVAGRDLRELFSHCSEPPAPECSDADLAAYMQRHRLPDTYYSGMPHVTHQDVRDEQALRRAIETFVDDDPAAFVGLTALEARAKIRAFVESRPELERARRRKVTTLTDMLVLHRHVIGLGLAGSLLCGVTFLAWGLRSSALATAAWTGWGVAIAIVLGLVFLIAAVRYYEWKHDRWTAPRPPDDKVRAIERTQLNPVINEMTVAGPIKLGFWRPLVLRIALWIVARYVTTLRVTIPTVASARWLAIDGGRRLVFVSNFTNMSEGYVRDFIDIRAGAERINLVFGWGHGYPATRLLYKGGAADDSNGFIDVVYYNQIATDCWYCPYKDLNIDNIVANRALRQGLHGDLTEWQAQRWLRHL